MAESRERLGYQVGSTERGTIVAVVIVKEETANKAVFNSLIEYVKVMSVMCRVNYLPYHKVHL